MSDRAEFRSSRGSNAMVGIGLVALTACLIALPIYASEEEFLHTRIRRGGGLLKLIEQTIGWHLFIVLIVLIVLFGAWCAVYAIVHIWKAIDPTPDVMALSGSIEFHPAVRRSAITYDEISYWEIEFVSGHPVLWLHFHEPYWSLQGLFKRRTIKLEGGKEEVEPLVNFFVHHPEMSRKFVRG